MAFENWYRNYPPCEVEAFEAAKAAYAAGRLEEREANGWISVKDSLPDDGELVVVYDPENQPTVWPSKYDSDGGVFLSNGGWFQQDEVTHWRPLPAAPKGDRNGQSKADARNAETRRLVTSVRRSY